MQAAAMRDHVRDRIYEVSPDQFEVLCKMVLVRRLDTESLKVTAFRQDEGIDVEGVIDEGIIRAWLGVQAKQYAEGNTVGIGSLQRFRGALARGNHQIGTYVTSSSFTGPAAEEADDAQLCLIDGDRLVSIMVEDRIGVTDTTSGLVVQDDFWQAFEEPEREDVVPSNEVPLANSFETLRIFLRAIDATDGSKRQITQFVNHDLGESFESRHADLYGTAGWLLGFVHRDTPKRADGREVRCWGLTRDGTTYLTLHEQGNPAEAEVLLCDAIRDVEIIRRIYSVLDEEERMTYDRLRGVMADETTLSDSSIERRASTVVQWLTVLPEIETERDGRSKALVRR